MENHRKNFNWSRSNLFSQDYYFQCEVRVASLEGFPMKENAVKSNLIDFIRQRLAEHKMLISEESLEFTAERYALRIIENPELTVSKLLDEDIHELERLLDEIHSRPKAV